MNSILYFILFAALMTLVALALILLPLLRRARKRPATGDAEQAATALKVLSEQIAELESELEAGNLSEADYELSRQEVEKRALEEGDAVREEIDAAPATGWGAMLALAVPLLAVAFYLILGEPAALSPRNLVAPPAAGGQHQGMGDIATMIESLEARLKNEPNDVRGWIMLARTYMMTEQFDKAIPAFEHLDKLMPDSPDVLADWADAVAAQQGAVTGEPEKLLEKALAIDPNHFKTLMLVGTAAFQRGEFEKASSYWEHILEQLPDDGQESKQQLRSAINDARAKGGLPPLPESNAAVGETSEAFPAEKE